MAQLVKVLLPFVGSGPETWKVKPFSVKIEGVVWSVATDGCWLMAAKEGGFAPNTSLTPKVLAIISSEKVEPCYHVEVAKLREWVGSPPSLWEFDDESQDPGILFDIVLDRRRLACLLTKVTSEKVQVWNSTSVLGVRSIGFETQNLRVFLAGLDVALLEEGEEPTPMFMLKPRSAMEMLMDLEDEDGVEA